jgi:eukaryotic-like serine/threonine-protein kinase
VPAALPPGTRVGPYEIQQVLGAGAMGDVYVARDSRLGRDVAVKVLATASARDSDRLQRFEQEARAAAALNHPNILAVHDIGSHHGAPFIVSERLHGETLRSRLLPGEPMPLRKAIDYAAQIARGLAAAHDRGIVHRDLKPENVFVTADGIVKILDFGLAKLSRAAARSGADSASVFLTIGPDTEPGMMLGTIGYIAPEQVRGREVDSRADIFAFGAILYEMLSGRRAFGGGTPADTLGAILEKSPPELPSAERRIPAALARIVDRCLEKDPVARFQSSRDLAFAIEALDLASDSSMAVSTPAGAAGRTWSTYAGWIAAAALAVALAAIVANRRTADTDGPVSGAVRVTVAAPPGASFALFGATRQGSVTLSPDGQRMALVADDRLWVRDLAALEARSLQGTEGASWPFWSPDGISVAFVAGGQLKRVSLATGGIDTIRPIGSIRGGSWAPDGRILLSTGGRLHVLDADGVSLQRITELDRARGDAQHSYPQWLPNGRDYLFLVRTTDAPTTGIYAGTLDSARQTFLVPSDTNAQYASGRLFFLRQGSAALWTQAIDLDGMALRGTPSRLADQIGLSTWPWDVYAAPFSVSSTGVLAYHATSMVESQLVWYDRAGRVLDSVAPAAIHANPEISPDGAHVAVDRFNPLTGQTEVILIDMRRGNSVPVRRGRGSDLGAAWAPDGAKVLFTSNAEKGRLALYIKDLADDRIEKVADLPAPAYAKRWASDGRFALFTTLDGTLRIDRVDLAQQTVEPWLTGSGLHVQAQISPDGRWVAFTSTESGRPEVYVRPLSAPGRTTLISSAGGRDPRWRRDGRELYYVHEEGAWLSGGTLLSVDVRTGPGRAVRSRAAAAALHVSGDWHRRRRVWLCLRRGAGRPAVSLPAGDGNRPGEADDARPELASARR